MAKTISRLNVYIGFDSSMSGSIDMGDAYAVGLVMPDVWTPARVSVQVSIDNIEFHDLFDFAPGDSTSAKEVVFNVTPGVAVAIDPNTLLMARYVKLRSGTRDEPIDQKATCMFTLLTVDTLAMTTQSKSAEAGQ